LSTFARNRGIVWRPFRKMFIIPLRGVFIYLWVKLGEFNQGGGYLENEFL